MMEGYKGCEDRTSRWHALLRGTRQGWIIQKEHTRKVIFANRDMLRDLECDKDDSDFTELVERYDLPGNLPSYHEWVFLEHKGVRVFRVYEDSSTRLSLRPEPEFRNAWRRPKDGEPKIVFEPYCLPTWHRKPSHWRSPYEHPAEDREAVIAAIEQGIITPTKITNDKGRCG